MDFELERLSRGDVSYAVETGVITVRFNRGEEWEAKTVRPITGSASASSFKMHDEKSWTGDLPGLGVRVGADTLRSDHSVCREFDSHTPIHRLSGLPCRLPQRTHPRGP